jgi:hypothetical protein
MSPSRNLGRTRGTDGSNPASGESEANSPTAVSIGPILSSALGQYGPDIESTANEIRGNVGLEIRKRQAKIGLQGEDIVDVRRREDAHAWLLAAGL